ncbi:hypothetical protein [Nodularia sp. NIES-3585]|uniref:hypothetical protein n=1 Tax=Nodularia sp. NIES-3585 TaxID=1973477 RepID=UPI000B6A4A07|nr:hypothetical protein [Nodularia sp. NIES-3585]GAX38838.1 hypothetical protein NIES3585_48900 [Nodularia sp. NIES-3585]
MSESENFDFELQAEQLAQFAREQMSEEKTEFFNDIWQEAGVKDVRKMTIQDARRTLAILSNSEASIEFVKVFYGQAITNGMPSHVLNFILQSDTDGDGRTLAQEVFMDNTNPFRADQPVAQQRYCLENSHDLDLEL